MNHTVLSLTTSLGFNFFVSFDVFLVHHPQDSYFLRFIDCDLSVGSHIVRFFSLLDIIAAFINYSVLYLFSFSYCYFNMLNYMNSIFRSISLPSVSCLFLKCYYNFCFVGIYLHIILWAKVLIQKKEDFGVRVSARYKN